MGLGDASWIPPETVQGVVGPGSGLVAYAYADSDGELRLMLRRDGEDAWTYLGLFLMSPVPGD